MNLLKSRRFWWLWFGMIVCLLVGVMTVSVGATGAEIEAVPVTEVENNTLLGRVEEYIRDNRAEVLTAGGDVLFGALGVAYYIWQRGKTKHTLDKLNALNGYTSEVTKSQGGVVKVANGLIDGFEKVRKDVDDMVHTYRNMKDQEDQRDRLVATLVVQNATLMEMLQTAYSHSQLPQGTKDLVVWKYTQCLRITEDDEKMAAIMEGVRRELTPPEGIHGELTPPETAEEEPQEEEAEEVQI